MSEQLTATTVTTNLRKNGSVKTINFDGNTKFKTLTDKPGSRRKQLQFRRCFAG